MDEIVYNPSIHTEIARLRKRKGLDDGNTPPPDDIKLWGTFEEYSDWLVEDAAEEAGEGGGEAGG